LTWSRRKIRTVSAGVTVTLGSGVAVGVTMTGVSPGATVLGITLEAGTIASVA
jgi:hypothetical protein